MIQPLSSPNSQLLRGLCIKQALCCILRLCPALRDITALPLGSIELVPKDEERLREVRLDTPSLMMDIVVGTIVCEQLLQWIPRQRVPAMITHCLQVCEREEEQYLACVQPSKFCGQASADCVHHETFHWVIVDGAICVWNVQFMMTGVELVCAVLR